MNKEERIVYLTHTIQNFEIEEYYTEEMFCNDIDEIEQEGDGEEVSAYTEDEAAEKDCPISPIVGAQNMPHWREPDTRRGYCGLVGRVRG